MADEQWSISEVRLVQASRVEVGADGTPSEVVYEEWEIDLATPGGRLTHFLPVDTVAWRLAEYGLDPADPDHHALALDMALHEPHIPQPEAPPPRSTIVQRWTPTAASAKKAASEPVPQRYDAAENLLTAPSLDDARETHLAQIAKAKERVQIATKPQAKAVVTDVRSTGSPLATASAQPDPLDWILQHTADRVDAEDVAGKRAALEQARASEQRLRTTPGAS